MAAELKRLKARLMSVSPLLCHNGKLADPLSEGAKRLKKLSGKRTKTDADLEQMARIEFVYSLYLNDEGYPCIPGEILEAALVAGAKRHKKGKAAAAGIMCPDNYPLVYDGPRDPEAMWQDGRFTFSTSVRVKQNRINRTRPRFAKWEAEIEILYDPHQLDESEVRDIANITGQSIGIGDWRPKFGRFNVEFLN